MFFICLQIERQVDGRLELLSHIDKTMHEGLKRMVSTTTVFTQTESLLAGALGRALLYIRNQESLDPLGKKIHARILLIKISSKLQKVWYNFIYNTRKVFVVQIKKNNC